MKKEKLTRREREKLRQRQEMLAAALELFSEKGYHNVSMHEIAEKSEFAIGTLYKFFQSKEDLYRALLMEECHKFHDAFVRAMEQSKDEVEQLRNYVRVKGEMFRNNLPFIRLYLAESRGVSYTVTPGLYAELRDKYHGILERLAAIFESGIREGRFRAIADPYYLAVALDSAVNALHLLWLESPESYPYPEDPDAVLNIFFKELIES